MTGSKSVLILYGVIEVVADEWATHQEDLSDLSFTLYHVCDAQDALQGGYALVEETELPGDLGSHRYMNVDLMDFLGRIAEKVIIHYPKDWDIDQKALRRIAASDDPVDKRLMWHVSSYGTHLQSEHDVFIRDTPAHNCWTSYRPNDPDMFGYAIKITGYDGLVIKGNVFFLGDYAEHARYVRETAQRLDSVTLTYSDDWGVNAGKTITVPRKDYDKDRHHLMSESGNVVMIRYHPTSELDMDLLLSGEHLLSGDFPASNCEAHLRNLTARLEELRNPSLQPEAEKEPVGLAEKLRAVKEKANAQPAPGPSRNRQAASLE